jgi:eukaryotic-like serine/threonine-protein kinase
MIGPAMRATGDIPRHEPPDAEFDSHIERFETAWRAGRAPRIDDYLVGPEHPRRRELLCELICIDLENRWKAGVMDASLSGALRPALADYADRFPELGDLASLPIELIGEEYRVRHRWGDRPPVEYWIALFPGRAKEIGAALAAINDELRREAPRPAPPPAATADPSHDRRLAPLSDRD